MRKLNWIMECAPSQVAEGAGAEFMVTGDAIHETTTRNGHKFIADELRKSAASLVGRPFMKDHATESVDNIIGVVKEASFDEKDRKIRYKARVDEEKYQRMIKDGRIKNVSVGAIVDELEAVEGDEGAHMLKGIQFTELSVVAVPADPNASVMNMSFGHAISESFKEELAISESYLRMKTKMEEAKSMTDTKNTTSTSSGAVASVTETADVLSLKERIASLEKQLVEKAKVDTDALKAELKKELVNELAVPKGKVAAGAETNEASEEIEQIGNAQVVREKDGSYFVAVKSRRGTEFTRVKTIGEVKRVLAEPA